MSFAKQLKIARETAGYTRSDLAEKLNISKSAISNYENGISSPKEEILFKIFKILDVEPNFLFKDEYNLKQSNISNYSTDEERIINMYRNINQTGQEAILAHLELLAESTQYKKCDIIGMGKKEA